VDVTVVQKPYEFGRLSIKLLDLLKKDNKDIEKALQDMKPELEKLNMKMDLKTHIIDTGVTVVTPQNAPAFLKELKEKGLEST
jgi:ribose transport system substrate-binding protein